MERIELENIIAARSAADTWPFGQSFGQLARRKTPRMMTIVTAAMRRRMQRAFTAAYC
ncbi:hypothetical protein [Paraburkholderia diazotrophica]|uniref:hypothetical protein n=1 Tax=Paraburkholderia diazotrophica TaxID=667676 RepID=UPI0015A6320B|nr:hypothetical protein [Paraburkholderia diazotrophica]